MTELVDSAISELQAQGYTDNIEIYRSLEARYLGQNHELELSFPANDFDDDTVMNLWCRFHEEHTNRFGFCIPGETIETVTGPANPGPEVGGNTETHPRIVGTILGAMAEICLNDEVICSQMTDRHVFAPWGLYGGKTGGLGATLVLKAGTKEWQNMREAYGKKSTSRYSNVRIEKGDRLRLVSPGGGGYGDPGDRQREFIVNDIKQGYVSLEGAEHEYGYKEA